MTRSIASFVAPLTLFVAALGAQSQGMWKYSVYSKCRRNGSVSDIRVSSEPSKLNVRVHASSTTRIW